MKKPRNFRRLYSAIFQHDPVTANALLLISELADSKGRIHIKGGSDQEVTQELQRLFLARFNDPAEFAL